MADKPDHYDLLTMSVPMACLVFRELSHKNLIVGLFLKVQYYLRRLGRCTLSLLRLDSSIGSWSLHNQHLHARIY